MTRPVIPDDVKAQIPELLWDPDEERVAVLAGRNGAGGPAVTHIWQARNHHADRRDHFKLGKRQWDKFHRRAESLGLSVVGLIHSHNDPGEACPSDWDTRFSARYPDVLQVTAIYHSPTGELIWYDAGGELDREHLGKPGLTQQLKLLFS